MKTEIYDTGNNSELAQFIPITGLNPKTGKEVKGPQWVTIYAIELKDVKVGDFMRWSADVQVTNDTHKIKPPRAGYTVGVSTLPFLSSDKTYAGLVDEVREGNGNNLTIEDHHQATHRSGVYVFKQDFPSVWVCFGVRCYSTAVIVGDYIVVNQDYGNLQIELVRG